MTPFQSSSRHVVNLFAVQLNEIIGSLSSDVFEQRTSTGSEPFSLLVRLYATVFILPSVLILIETICPKICSKSRLKCAKSPFPVDVRRSKTSLLKLPNVIFLYRPSKNKHKYIISITLSLFGVIPKMIIQDQENVLPWLLQCMNAEGQRTNQISQKVD